MSVENMPTALTGRAFLWRNLDAWAAINTLLGFADVVQSARANASAAAAL